MSSETTARGTIRAGKLLAGVSRRKFRSFRDFTIYLMCSCLLWSVSAPTVLSQPMEDGEVTRSAVPRRITYRPILAKPEVAPLQPSKPTSLLQGGITDAEQLHFGAILLKKNNDFPKSFVGV